MSGTLNWPSTRISLLERIRRAEDEPAWRAFVELYAPLIYRFARKRGLQDADATDVAQDVLLIVSRAIRRFELDPERGRFRAWLGTVTGNAIEKHRRKLVRPGRGAGGELSPAVAQEEGAASGEWVAEFNAHIFRRALERIRREFSPEVWQAFELVWLEDVPPQEAAAQLKQKAQWIYKAKYNVLRRLKAEVLFLAADVAVFARE